LSSHHTGRHDDPDEKANDEMIAKINASHRFNSFAEERSNNIVKWCFKPFFPSHPSTA
jgi:hypothetical protein